MGFLGRTEVCCYLGGEIDFLLEVVEMGSEFVINYDNGVVKIRLSGRLDATNTPAFQEGLKRLIGKPISRLVFFVDELEYIASAGIRAILFAKQKIGMDADVYLINPQETVLDIIQMTGLDNFLNIQDSYDG